MLMTAILAHTAEEPPTKLNLLTEAYQSLGLSINITKTEIIYQPASGHFEGLHDIKPGVEIVVVR